MQREEEWNGKRKQWEEEEKKGTRKSNNCCDNLEFDAIEFVEAGPSASRGQTLEEFTHGKIVQSITAVEHHTLYSHGLGQILHCFRLQKSSVNKNRLNQC
jgi:hypothetical protein